MLIIYFAFHGFLLFYQGTEKVQAMDIRDVSSKNQNVSFWNPNAFLKMPNLKFLRNHFICPQFVPKYLPDKLTYFEWSNYPSKSLPCSFSNVLVQLHLQCSKIELLWRGMKVSVLITILIQICFKISIINI